jgi:hypothetical protein
MDYIPSCPNITKSLMKLHKLFTQAQHSPPGPSVAQQITTTHGVVHLNLVQALLEKWDDINHHKMAFLVTILIFLLVVPLRVELMS